ncbi:glycosyltransferase [Rhodopseudomonas palustris]|uniref:glycosyltransferase n=1 Tax=Rhodopseudomonas palustris TaxID=1076 RepID=UPI000164950C|nr:glycosyltransferase [Rhodopseudomonas palustris]
MTRPLRILFVAMHTSVHAARWIEQTSKLGFDCHVFPINDLPPHHLLGDATLHVPTLSFKPALSAARSERPDLLRRLGRIARLVLSRPDEAARRLKERLLALRSVEIVDMSASQPCAVGPIVRHFPVDDVLRDLSAADQTITLGLPGESDAATARLYGPEVLAALIERLQPDLIHSMEFQHAGYLTLSARDRIKGRFPRWLATNWGSDIYYFGRDAAHAAQIRRLCAAIDVYSCECHRDIGLAREFGYRGPELPVLPNSGGIDIAHIEQLRDPTPPSARRLIMVKGYDHFAGRAMVSLAVLERFAAQLRDFTVVLFSVGARPRARAIELAQAGTLDIRVIDWATHDEILRHFGRARLYLGISISDAISTSVLEAMAMGAFPIQTDTSCCAEWFVPDQTGFTVPVDDFEVICERFQRALTDDALVDAAAPRNFDIIRSRLAIDVMLPKMREFYRQALIASRTHEGEGEAR